VAAIQLIPNVGGLFLSEGDITALAASKLRLFKTGYSPSITDTLAMVVAQEVSYSGYAAGGIELTAWVGGYISPQGGIGIASPQVEFAYVTPEGTPVTDIAGGWFLVDATGNLVAEGTFDSPIPMGAVGDGFPISLQLFRATTNILVSATVFGSEQ